jgi:rare lipoprotein A
VFAATLVAATAFVVLTARCTADALARAGGYASAYGPGLYGNRLACGGRLTTRTVAVAHKTLRCGTRLRVCYRRRCVRARVRDRGPYVRGRTLDLTEGAVRRLGFRSARSWGVRFIHYEEVGR